MPIVDVKEAPLYLMDGSAYIYRSFYANQSMTRADGLATNVLFGVLRLLLKLLREERPAYFGFIMDGRGKNFRHRLYEPYKANRDATPEPLAAQIEPLKELILALGFHITVSEDCEADDCIASLAAKFRKERPVLILGADKDLKQCLHEDVKIWDPSAKETRLTTLESFTEEYGFGPELWPDYQALIGDSSDNIPGVPGIGPKGASTLMKDFPGLEAIAARMVAVPPALRKKLDGHMEEAFLCRKLTTLQLDACDNVGLNDLALSPIDTEKALSLMDKYELRSLHRELSSMSRIKFTEKANAGSKQPTAGKGAKEDSGQNSQTGAAESANTFPVEDIIKQNSAPSGSTEKSKELPLLAMGNGAWAQGSLISSGPNGFGNSISDSEEHGPNLFTTESFNALPILSATALQAMPTLGASIALLIPSDFSENSRKGLVIGTENGTWFWPEPDESGEAGGSGETDGMDKADGPADSSTSALETLAAFLDKISAETKIITPDLRNILAAIGETKKSWKKLLSGKISMGQCLDLSLAAWLLNPEEYAYTWPKLYRRWQGEMAEAAEEGKKQNNPCLPVLALGTAFAGMLHGAGLETLLSTLEQPLVPVLLEMQREGIAIDITSFAEFLQETESQLEKLGTAIYKEAGMPFNIRSAKQLGDVLFKELKLPGAGKTQGGQASTSEEALSKLIGKHPIIELLLEYRKLEKLRSTYLDPLPKLVDENKRLHTTFKQSATATGRLSSVNPNLQNIPVRGAQGQRMRACFTAAQGNLLVSADYSQIELRVLAHLSQDKTMLESFRHGEDIHSRTASLLFDIPQSEITPDQRRSAKTINFGLIYGMGAQSLAQDLHITQNEAKAFISRYFEHLTGLKEYFERIEAEAKAHGFVTTMTGRRRPCPEILSANQQLRSRARRQAINTCIQGTAADIIKLAMLAAAKDPELAKLEARLVLQIHDELLLEAPKANAEAAGKRLAEIMGSVQPGGIKIDVPLATDWGIGENWAKAH